MRKYEVSNLWRLAENYHYTHSEVVGDSRTVYFYFDSFKDAYGFYESVGDELRKQNSDLAPFKPYQDIGETEYLVAIAPDSESKHYISAAQKGSGYAIDSDVAELPTSGLRLDWLEQDEK